MDPHALRGATLFLPFGQMVSRENPAKSFHPDDTHYHEPEPPPRKIPPNPTSDIRNPKSTILSAPKGQHMVTRGTAPGVREAYQEEPLRPLRAQ